MSTFNAAVFDAVAVGLSETFSVRQLNNETEVVLEALQNYRSLFENKDFFSAVSGSVNDAAKVVHRIEAMKSYLAR